jgi:hypothetical protein
VKEQQGVNAPNAHCDYSANKKKLVLETLSNSLVRADCFLSPQLPESERLIF